MAITLRVTDIPVQGLEITESLALDLLNERMNDAPNNDIVFIDTSPFSLMAKTTKGGILITGNISGSYSQPCGRCLEEITHQLDKEISLTLKPKETQPGRERTTTKQEWQDDIGIVYFDGEHIELEEILQETLILSLSPFNSNHNNCPGEQEIEKNNSKNKEEKGTLLGDALKEILN